MTTRNSASALGSNCSHPPQVHSQLSIEPDHRPANSRDTVRICADCRRSILAACCHRIARLHCLCLHTEQSKVQCVHLHGAYPPRRPYWRSYTATTLELPI